MSKSTADSNREIASRLAGNLPRLLREFSRDFDERIGSGLAARGYPGVRAAHSTVLANLGMGVVRVTDLAARARVTQQAMGKLLKELERQGYVARDVDSTDKRARAIRLTQRGEELAQDSVAVVESVRSDYARQIGENELDSLEAALRTALGRLQLEHLPGDWHR